MSDAAVAMQVDASVAATDLIYTGAEQMGVAAAEGYTVSGGSAADAGDYTATVTLADGYEWTDGSNDVLEIPWSIAKAELTAAYAGETVLEGSAPELAVTVTGFVNGETAETAAGYVAPSVAALDSLEAGQELELTPSGGQADNYTFTYVPGLLKVVDSGKQIAPGTYTVTANVWLKASDASAAGFPLLAGLVGADGAAYMTNPANPLGKGGYQGLPTKPVEDNGGSTGSTGPTGAQAAYADDGVALSSGEGAGPEGAVGTAGGFASSPAMPLLGGVLASAAVAGLVWFLLKRRRRN